MSSFCKPLHPSWNSFLSSLSARSRTASYGFNRNLDIVTGVGIGVGSSVLLVLLLKGKFCCVGIGELDAGLLLAAKVDDRAGLFAERDLSE